MHGRASVPTPARACGSSTPRRAGAGHDDPARRHPGRCARARSRGRRAALDPRRAGDARRRGGRRLGRRARRPAVAGRRADARPAPASLDPAWLPVLAALAPGAAAAGPAGRRRAQRRRAGGLPHRRRGRGRRGPRACRSRCTRPASPSSSRAPTSCDAVRRTASPVHVVQGHATRSAPRPRSRQCCRPGRVARRGHRGPLDRRARPAAVAALVVAAAGPAAEQRPRAPTGNAAAGGRALTDLSAPAPGKVTTSCSSSTPQPPAGPG